VRRASAISLLFAMSFSLIASFVFTDLESNLPECCRRDGTHHCGMLTTDDASSGGSSLRSGQRCSSFPLASALPSDAAYAFLNTSSAIFAALVSHPAVQRQTEALGRVSFSRSRQKRGPPALLS
jgi:hypothetical protein